MNENRKRMRSAEDDFGIQTKFFVNEQLIEKSDPKLMKVVYEKTLNLIFNGAKLQSQKQQNSANNNVAHPMSPVLDSVDDKLPESKGCMLCWKDVDSTPNFICKNCNLKICISCTQRCCNCNLNLCSNCVNIFGCSYKDFPICEDCKFYAE